MHRGRIIAVPPQFIRAFRPFHTNLKSYNVATVPEGQLRVYLHIKRLPFHTDQRLSESTFHATFSLQAFNISLLNRL